MNFDLSSFVLLAVLIIALIFYIYVRRHYKLPKFGCLSLVTGGVKAGKSTFAVYAAFSNFKRSLRLVKIRNYFLRLFGRSDRQSELPLLYSNIPLDVPYVPVTEDLLLRKKRFRYRSVIYINEASLLADSQLFRDMDLNTRLLVFNKLIGHETKGGMLIYDTQSTSDLHYSIKRSLSEYFYIHHMRKGLFFNVAYVIENRYSDDGTIVTISHNDVEEPNYFKKVLIPKKIWKIFDCYCYSKFTDDLPVEDRVVKSAKSLKANSVLSFRSDINKILEVDDNEKK